MNSSNLNLVGLAVAAGLTAYLLGRRKVVIICASAAIAALSSWLAVLGYRATHRQPERPVELTLQLARPQWRLKENPWYLLQIKNVGYKEVDVHDKFWSEQVYLSENSHMKFDTYFELVDPDGKEMKFSAPWGIHGEFMFWANDCGGKICDVQRDRFPSFKVLKRGQVLTATPSVVAPLRKQQGFRSLLDARIPPGATPAEQEAYQKLWRMQGFDSYAPPQRPLYPGYRVLEGFSFEKTGRYRMKVIYEPISSKDAEEMIRDGKTWLTLGGLPSETRIYRYESNVVEFEVVP